MARAQAAGQVWGNAIFDWLTSPRRTYEIEVESKDQTIVPDTKPTFMDIKVTPQAKHAVVPWMDALAEADVEFKAQSNEVNNTIVTPRVGVQFHILSRLMAQHDAASGEDLEAHPKRRIDVSTLLRLERQTTVTSGDTATTSSWRFRNRFAAAYPLNRPKVTSAGAIYLTSDYETFSPVDEPVKGGRVSEVRIRTGLGYRLNYAWRFDTLYIWDGKRNKTSGVMAPDAHGIDVRVRRQF